MQMQHSIAHALLPDQPHAQGLSTVGRGDDCIQEQSHGILLPASWIILQQLLGVLVEDMSAFLQWIIEGGKQSNVELQLQEMTEYRPRPHFLSKQLRQRRLKIGMTPRFARIGLDCLPLAH